MVTRSYSSAENKYKSNVTFAALAAELCLNARMYDSVEVEMLSSFEALAAHSANVRPVRVVAQFVPFQMLFAL